jgi:3-hydroxy-5-methyl-1-naphthoate 3-O-methyltransferase
MERAILHPTAANQKRARKEHATMGGPERPPPSLGVIDEVNTLGLKVTVLKTAMELDVFTIIASGHQHLEEIAYATCCSIRGMRVLLDALCPLGLLSKSAGRYGLTPTAAAYLVRTAPTCCADIYLTWFQNRERFADCVRTGTPAIDLTAPEAEDLWVSYAAQFLMRWPELAELMRSRWEEAFVHVQTVSGAYVLDVACGPGVKSFMLAQADPTVRVMAVDTPKVLAVTAQIAEAMGVAAQVSYQAGDVVQMELGSEQFDLVLLGNILHFFPPNQIQDILRKVHQALRFDGQVVIDDGVLDEERCQAEPVLLSAVEIVNSAPDAEFYTFSQYRELLEGVGFTQVTLHGDRPVSARKKQRARMLSGRPITPS